MRQKNLNSIERLMDGYNPHRQVLEQTRALVDKWEPTGLLEGLSEENKVHGMAVLLENQARELIDEASRTGTAGSQEEWSGVALPLVRKIFGELAAQDFVSVQPMNLPSGLIFYLDFTYGTTQSGIAANEQVFGVTSGSGDPNQGLYGAGKFGYSANDSDTDPLTFLAAGPAAATYNTGSGAGTVAWKDVDFEPTLSSSIVAGTLAKIVTAGASYSNEDQDGVRAFEVSGSEIDAFYPAYTTYSATDDTITFIVKVGTPATEPGASIGVKYHKAPVDTGRGDFEVSSAQDFTGGTGTQGSADIPEIDIQMRSIPIVAKTRKLKAVWTPELAQDLNAYHSVDAEAELTSLLSEYVSMEIDLEILDMLYANASAKTEYWSARPAYEYDTATSLFAETSVNASAYTKGTWFQTLGNKIQSVSNAIHQKTLRGGANFLVVSPEVATIIESIPGYAADTSGEATQTQFAMGVQKVGMLNNRWTVYKNPYMFENVVLCGFRGSNFLETGAVYSPYVPLIMTPLVYDPVNFTPRKGVMTRYAKKIVRPEFYGKVIVADVNYV